MKLPSVLSFFVTNSLSFVSFLPSSTFSFSRKRKKPCSPPLPSCPRLIEGRNRRRSRAGRAIFHRLTTKATKATTPLITTPKSEGQVNMMEILELFRRCCDPHVWRGAVSPSSISPHCSSTTRTNCAWHEHTRAFAVRRAS